MKVLWLASWYPNKRTELNGDFIQRQANSCTFEEVEIIVLHVCSRTNSTDYELVVNTQANKNPITEIIVYYPETIKPLKFLKFLKAHQKGIEYLEKINWSPDFIHIHVIYPSFLAYLYFFRKLPFIISEHYGAYRLKDVFKNRCIFKWISKYAISKAQMTIALNESMAVAMQNNGMNGNYTFLPNVVDTTIFFPIDHKNKVFRWLHVSNMDDSIKNVTGIIRVFSKIFAYRTDFEIVLIGDGVDKKKIVEYSQRLGIERFVTFKTNLPHYHIAEEMQVSDAFIMFSNYEGLPCVILEAMSTGLPIVTSETGGISEWVKNNIGIVIQPKNELALENAIIKIMEEYQNYQKNSISKLIQENCSNLIIGNSIVEMYKKIINHNQQHKKT